ncbi:MAG: type II toxin-antitoxin system VapC family toxin [Geminicoccaceae bacterium]
MLDTNVLSEARRSGGSERVRRLLRQVGDAGLFISVLTLGEIRSGIERLPENDKRRALTHWLAELRERYASRILVVDADVADRWGSLAADLAQRGRPLPAVDLLLAATALTHGLAIATRNVRDFAATGVDLVDPWTDELPS